MSHKRNAADSEKAAGEAPGASNRPLGDRIHQAKRELEQMIDLNPESMVLVSEVGHVLRTNRAFVELLGAEGFESALGHTLTELFPTDDPHFFETLLATRAGSESQEVFVTMGNTQRRLMRFTVVSGVRGSGTLIVIARDATLEKSRADLMRKTYKVEAVHALMGALMHHLNQPLTVLMVRAKLMQQAVEQGTADAEDLKATFKDIMVLTMQMADVLKRVKESDGYETQPYIQGLDILKIDDV